MELNGKLDKAWGYYKRKSACRKRKRKVLALCKLVLDSKLEIENTQKRNFRLILQTTHNIELFHMPGLWEPSIWNLMKGGIFQSRSKPLFKLSLHPKMWERFL